MLILIVGDTTDYDPRYITRCAAEVSGVERRIKIFPFDINAPSNTHIDRMIYTHRHADPSTVDFDDMVIICDSDRGVSPKIRANAAYIIFTDVQSFEGYFCRPTNDDPPMQTSSVIGAMRALTSRSSLVVFDRAGQCLYCLE
jgi:hypothetical protein